MIRIAALKACCSVDDPIEIVDDLIASRIAYPGTGGVRLKNRNKVFRAGQDKFVGILGVAIERQTLVCLTRDRGQADIPTHAEWAVART